jgi:hypothetical protein
MKRSIHDEQELRERTAYIHGRIERELEAFASSLAIPAMELTQRVGRLLLGEGPRVENHLPHVRLEARPESRALATLESVERPHGGSPRLTAGGRAAAAQAPVGEVKPPPPIKLYWAQFTPDERKQMMKERHAKWSPAAKKTWMGGQAVVRAERTGKARAARAAKAKAAQ